MYKNKMLILISNLIVKFRYLFLIIFILITVIGIINKNNFKVNYDIISYLPNDTETKKGLKLLNKEFNGLNTMQLLITNTNYEDVLQKIDEISKINHVKNIMFDKTENYYKENNALIIIDIDKVTEQEKNDLRDNIVEIVKDDQYYLYIENNKTHSNNKTIILTIIIITIVILLTSHSYFEIILTAIIISTSTLINIGSNFILGEISYITNSTVVIIQIFLTLQYLMMFLNNYNKETDDNPNKILAIKKTLYKSIPKIIPNSIIIIIILMSLLFMDYKLISDFGIALSKSIICSILTIILLLPSLLTIFNNIILKFRHRFFIPNLKKISKLIISGQKIIIPLFLLLFFISLLLPRYNYTYKTHIATEEQKIEEIFGLHNRLIVIVQNQDKDYTKELQISKKILQDKKIINVTNLGNMKINDNIYLGNSINYQEFSEMFNVDINKSEEIYKQYAEEKSEITKTNDMDNYHIPIINLIYFLYEHQEYVKVDNSIINYYQIIQEKKNLFENKNYSLFKIDYKDKKDTFQLLDMLEADIKKEYNDVTLVGESVSVRDLKNTFHKDNLKILLITLLIILLITFLIFKSISIPIIISFIVEACVLINFGFNHLINNEISFISYQIANIVQIILTLNYIIIICKKYQLFRKKMNKQNSIQRVIQESFPTIIINSFILIILSILLKNISNLEVVTNIGILLTTGIIITMIIIFLVLPSILTTFDKFIQSAKLKNK